MIAALLGGGFWALTAASKSAETEKSPVVVKVDSSPLARTEDTDLSFAPIVKRVIPSVVKIVVSEDAKEQAGAGTGSPFDDPMFRWFFGPMNPDSPHSGGRMMPQPRREGLGSGVIVSPDGYILTNNHVVADADKVEVTLKDGRELTAKVVGTDPKTDIAVIKVDATDLPAITFAKSDQVEVGDRVLAIGNPFGFGQTVTTGIVSAKGRAVRLGLEYEDFIQTDAAINPGNSGGALVDMHGRLIGINTAIYSRGGGFQGIGFAIPSDLAENIMNSLVTTGKVVRGFLGVSIQDLTPVLAEQFKLKEPKGALVSEVTPDSPADKGGLKSGDVILSLNGEDVKDSRALKFAVAGIAPGTDAKLTVLRDGKKQDLTVTVGEMPGEKTVAGNDTTGEDTGVLNGVGVMDLTPQVRNEFEIPARIEGAIVTQVDPNSASAEAGLAPGDVILEIDGKTVTSAQDAIKLTESSDDKKTLLRVWSRGATHFIVVDESGE